MKRNTKEIRQLILEGIDGLGKIPIQEIQKRFGISRQAIFKNMRVLMKADLVEKTELSKTPYRLKQSPATILNVEVSPQTEENRVWAESVAPLVHDLKDNVREICHYGFTEMFNNVIDHSQSRSAEINISRDALVVRMLIQDNGIGIWKKLQKEFGLDDPRHALLELTKGKLTTDPKRHTGEGIFFTSRMFDRFILESDHLSFCRFQEGDDWLFDVREEYFGPGTRVIMTIRLESTKTIKEIFDKFTSDLDDFGFTRTQLSVQLAKYEGDHLVSRSQAKRLLARLDKFKEVFLDFSGVTEIGQGFADEIFRVFKNEHPAIRLWTVNTTPDVERMISRAMKQESVNKTELPS